MPVYTGKGAGAQMAAAASVNRTFNTGVVVDAATFTSFHLATPGMTRLTWYIRQTAGVVPFLVTPQIAVRIAGLQTFDWQAAGPQVLTAPGGAPTFITLNTIATEAMRVVLLSQAPAGNPQDLGEATGILSASA